MLDEWALVLVLRLTCNSERRPGGMMLASMFRGGRTNWGGA